MAATARMIWTCACVRYSPYPGVGSVCFSAEIVRVYLTIIPRARMGSESVAHEAEGRMGYEGERNNCFSKIQLVSQKYRE